MSAFKIPTIYSVIDKFTAPVRRMAAAHDTFASKLETGVARGERMFRKFTPALSEAGKQFLSFASAAAIAGAIIAGITFSISSIKNYETAVQSFRTIVSDLNDKEFGAYERKVREVALATKKSSIDVVKGFEMIAGLNAEFAKTPEAIGAVTASAILLSKASRDDLGKSAANLTGILNQFELQADQSARVVNALAAGQAVGASSITQTADAFTVFGAVAKTANLSLEESIGLVEVLASKQIQGAEAGTALRGSILALQKAGLGYKSGVFKTRDALVEFNEKLNKLTSAKKKDAYMEKVFGVINRTSGTILSQNIELFDKFTKGVTGTSEAFKAAEINSNTLTNRLSEMQAKWITLITTSDNATKSLDTAKKAVVFLTDNMESIISIGSTVLGVLVAWKAALLAVKFVTDIVTAAQWLWNLAMAANPIGIIVIAVVALIGVMVAMIQKWHDWGAALAVVLGPLGFVISLIMSFKRNWDRIMEAITNRGFIGGIIAIGTTIMDAIIMPVQQLVELVAKLTGSKGLASAAKAMAIVRKGIGVNTLSDESGKIFREATDINSDGDWGVKQAVNPKAAERDVIREEVNKTQQFSSTLTIKDLTGRAELDNTNPLLQMLPRVGTTMGGW